MQQADVVFVGVVSDVVSNGAAGFRREVRFDVERTWTTDHVGSATVVDVPFEVWECGSKRPVVGERWLAYAALEGQRLGLSHCDRSRPIAWSDPEISELGSSCDPGPEIRLAIAPARIRVGDVFTVTVTSRGFSLMEARAATEPPDLAAMDPACPNPCRTSMGFRMRAASAGAGTLRVDAFGEAIACVKGELVFVWAYPRASVALSIQSAAKGPTPTPSATRTLPAARIALPYFLRPPGAPTGSAGFATPRPSP